MSKILLLYDTTEKDLIRDFKDLLDELNLSTSMIPLSPDKGLSLEDKEEYYLEDASGIIFIITPGSERLGSMYPSPSVSHEMGQVKGKFKGKPSNVIYLVDNKCNLPAIDQKSYILFNRNDMRSVIGCITLLVKNLKDASLYRTTPIPREIKDHTKKIDIQKLTQDIGNLIVKVLFDISNRLDGHISEKDLNDLLKTKYILDTRQINFIKKDMEKYDLVSHKKSGAPWYLKIWILKEIGWEIVKHEEERRKKEGGGLLNSFLFPKEGSLLNIPTSGQAGLLSSQKKISSPSCPNCSNDIKYVYMSPIPSDFIEIEDATHECTNCGYKTKI